MGDQWVVSFIVLEGFLLKTVDFTAFLCADGMTYKRGIH